MAKANADASAANAVASKASENSANANEMAAKSNLRAAEVEKQNTDLRIKFANRRINETQHKILLEVLSKSPSSFNIETMGDSESGLYAADMGKTVTYAHWTVDKKEFPLGVIWIGLILFKTEDPANLVIEDAFRKAHIQYKIGNENRKKATIMVGGRPPVF